MREKKKNLVENDIVTPIKECDGYVKVCFTRNFVSYNNKQYNIGDTISICKKIAEKGVKNKWCKVL